MTWLSVFSRIPILAVSTPAAVVAALLIAAVFGYRLEIDAIGLRFDKDPSTTRMETAARTDAQP